MRSERALEAANKIEELMEKRMVDAWKLVLTTKPNSTDELKSTVELLLKESEDNGCVTELRIN